MTVHTGRLDTGIPNIKSLHRPTWCKRLFRNNFLRGYNSTRSPTSLLWVELQPTRLTRSSGHRLSGRGLSHQHRLGDRRRRPPRRRSSRNRPMSVTETETELSNWERRKAMTSSTWRPTGEDRRLKWPKAIQEKWASGDWRWTNLDRLILMSFCQEAHWFTMELKAR